MGPLQWGDVPTWVGGAGALAAAWYAFQTITSQRQQIGEQQDFIAEQIQFMDEQRQNIALEREALLASAQERREAQARKIRLEVTPPYVKVVNQSGAPITDVHCLEDGQQPIRAAASKIKGAEAGLSMVLEQLRGQEQEHLDLLAVDRIGWFQRRAGLTGYVQVSFTDEAGVRWMVDSNGCFTEVTPDSAT